MCAQTVHDFLIGSDLQYYHVSPLFHFLEKPDQGHLAGKKKHMKIHYINTKSPFSQSQILFTNSKTPNEKQAYVKR